MENIDPNIIEKNIIQLDLKNPDDIKNHFPFIVTKNYDQYSRWDCKTVTFTDYGFKKDDVTYWLCRRTANNSHTWDYNDVALPFKILEKNDFQFCCYYCGKGMLGSFNKFIDPFEFITWIVENSYNFDKLMSSIHKVHEHNDHWRFNGNLDKYSCAFMFDIFDKNILNKLLDMIKNNHLSNIKITI